jgi:hypothetical protein
MQLIPFIPVRQVGKLLGRSSSASSVQPARSPRIPSSSSSSSTSTYRPFVNRDLLPTPRIQARRATPSLQSNSQTCMLRSNNNSIAIITRALERYAVASFTRTFATEPPSTSSTTPSSSTSTPPSSSSTNVTTGQPPIASAAVGASQQQRQQPAEPEEVVATKEKKSWPQRIREGLSHFWTGTKLLALVCISLIYLSRIVLSFVDS